LGIHVTCVAPGPLRTDRAGRSRHRTTSRIAEYAAARMQATARVSDPQAGDPERTAQAMIRTAGMDNPRRHLVLGACGVNAVTDRLRAGVAAIGAWRAAGIAPDFPGIGSV
jgi:NAD(P)-dependent dehydrogenase (short-subunit alcohol dehydrogenase family)